MNLWMWLKQPERVGMLMGFGFWPNEAEDYSFRDWNSLLYEVRILMQDREYLRERDND